MLNEVRLVSLFQKIINKPDAKPYPFQVEVTKSLLGGNNVMLIAPTGTGKTWAALLPYLYARKYKEQIFDRVIYALPLRTLATSLYDSTIKGCERAGWRIITDPNKRSKGCLFDELCITIQTGERKEDPFFQGDVIFTTIDQLLSSYLNMPVSLPEKLANINAGAVLGSLIVLDEIHLLEPERSLGTALEMAIRLKGYSLFLWMTATLSGGAIDLLKNKLNAQYIYVTKKELERIPGQLEKKKIYHWLNTPLEAKHVLEVHRGGRSIVICNSVKRAQEVYRSIEQKIKENNLATKLFLLHSRFFKNDRQQVEDKLLDYFGPDARETDVILVATQVVEAGIDISADNLHTELAPANSLVQRAGRCARYKGERGKGAVWVYELEQNEKGQYKMGPYRDQAEIVTKTRHEVQKITGNVDHLKEKQFVEKVLEKLESDQINRVIADLPRRYQEVNLSIELAGQGRTRSVVRNLIRDIDSLNVLIHDNPEKHDLFSSVEYLSLPRVSLWALQDLFNNKKEAWVAKFLVSSDDENEENGFFYWVEATSVKQLMTAGWLIALHPDIACYTPELGLTLGTPGLPITHPAAPEPLIIRPEYRCESFREHALSVVEEGIKILERHQMAIKNTSSKMGMEIKALVDLIKITLLLHDTGKLANKWQDAIRAWQCLVDPDCSLLKKNEPLAHSTFIWEKHHQLQREFQKDKRYQRKPHAVEGAFAIANSLIDFLENYPNGSLDPELAVVAWTAIARHHSAGAVNLSDFVIEQGMKNYVNNCLIELGFEPFIKQLDDRPSVLDQKTFGEKELLRPSAGGEKYLPFYWLVVRLLRLADQSSQRKNGEFVRKG